jgi:hypothetical protein
MEKVLSAVISSKSAVCSAHFPLNQFTNSSRSNWLLNNAIPNLSLPEINFWPVGYLDAVDQRQVEDMDIETPYLPSMYINTQFYSPIRFDDSIFQNENAGVNGERNSAKYFEFDLSFKDDYMDKRNCSS